MRSIGLLWIRNDRSGIHDLDKLPGAGDNMNSFDNFPLESPQSIGIIGRRDGMEQRKVWKRGIAAAVLAILIFMAARFLCSKELEITFYSLSSPKISGEGSIRVVLLSDLHNEEFGVDNRDLAEEIQRLKPDLIAMAGDMVNKQEEDTSVILSLCSQLIEIAPIYYGLGNHEGTMMYNHGQRVDHDLEALGVTVLINQSVPLSVKGNTFLIGSVSTTPRLFPEFSASFMEEFEKEEAFKLLIAHVPSLFYEVLADADVDLSVSGHFHGGQVVLPVLGGLYSVDCGLFPKYWGGMYELEKGSLVVSRGLGNGKPVPRINNRPEIAVIDIFGEEGGYGL